jgi:DNA-binding transcriptional LysR family regulator
VSIAQLQGERWVVPHGLSISYVFQGRFTAQGLDPPAQLLSTASLDLLIRSSLRLGAVTVVPRHLVAEQVRRGEMTALDCADLALDYDVVLVSRRRGSRTPSMNSFALLLREACAQLGGQLGTAKGRRGARRCAA